MGKKKGSKKGKGKKGGGDGGGDSAEAVAAARAQSELLALKSKLGRLLWPDLRPPTLFLCFFSHPLCKPTHSYLTFLVCSTAAAHRQAGMRRASSTATLRTDELDDVTTR
jgi:hypothetical protein